MANKDVIRISEELHTEIDRLRSEYVKEVFDKEEDKVLMKQIEHKGLSYGDFLKVIVEKYKAVTPVTPVTVVTPKHKDINIVK